MTIRTSEDLRRGELGLAGLRLEAQELRKTAKVNRQIGYKGRAASQECEARALDRAAPPRKKRREKKC
jgi:hypothetical protein